MPDAPRRHPMSYNDIGMVLARALQDTAFRDRLVADPKATIEAEYHDLSPGHATVTFFQSFHGNFSHAADRLKGARDAVRGARDM